MLHSRNPKDNHIGRGLTINHCRRVWLSARFGLFPFRSPLLGESRLISSPPGTEMFHFPGFALHAYVFSMQCPGFTPGGLPHSETHGSMLARSSPWHFAACRVLLRPLMPGHPPYALLVLTHSSRFQRTKEHPLKMVSRPALWSFFRTVFFP